MKKRFATAIALVLGFACSAGVLAQGMPKDDYVIGLGRIVIAYKSAKAGCASLFGNANDICIAEAAGRERVAATELYALYKPSEQTRYEARIAKVESAYAVAKERCDDLAGKAKDACMQGAKAAATKAKENAGDIGR